MMYVCTYSNTYTRNLPRVAIRTVLHTCQGDRSDTLCNDRAINQYVVRKLAVHTRKFVFMCVQICTGSRGKGSKGG